MMEKPRASGSKGQGGTLDVDAYEDAAVPSTQLQRWKGWLWEHLNFFRIHLLVFTFLPLFVSIIFWAVSGRYSIKYVDALYVCYSAFTNAGLAAFDLSRATPLQQALLFMQMFLGSPIVVSWIVVLVRKKTLARQCSEWIEKHRRPPMRDTPATPVSGSGRDPLTEPGVDISRMERGMPRTLSRSSTGAITPFRRGIIRRVDTALQKVDPSGRISQEPMQLRSPTDSSFGVREEPKGGDHTVPSMTDDSRAAIADLDEENLPNDSRSRTQNEWRPNNLEISSVSAGDQMRITSVDPATLSDTPPRTPRFVGFDLPTVTISSSIHDTTQHRSSNLRQRRTISVPQRSITWSEIDIRPKNQQMARSNSYQMPRVDERFVSRHSIGFGGFPGPIEIGRRLWRLVSTRWEATRIGRLFTPYPSVLLPMGQAQPEELSRNETREVPYFSFSAIVGRNSAFHGLTEEELEELGGVEYRGLRVLSYIVPCYYIGTQALGWIVNSLLMSRDKYQSLFSGQWRYVRPSWAGVFLGTSVTTNTGMSLVDTALVPFQSELGLLIVTSFQSLAGNTAFPILLRLAIWIGTKITSETSQAWATLHFLLDHPRRCFLYLFPSLQTWYTIITRAFRVLLFSRFLVIVIFILNMIDWAGFMLFDLDNPTLEPIPLNLRVLNGFLQATSVRCAGIASVSIAYLAPATQVLYLIMMYIAPYPIALAVRSTNVYEDRSLGIYEQEEDPGDKEQEYVRDKRSKPVVWGSYLAWHAKRQLAYDMWWIAAAWLLISIFERSKIWSPPTKRFDLFDKRLWLRWPLHWPV
ncbi:TrkH-domain-containing protein [Serendipita vermifera]|nr:TrkH-domain-containing protein [Serendipita vermifera]